MMAKLEGLETLRLAKVFDLLGEACRAATWGEFVDMDMTGKSVETEEAYEEMIRLKTSGLLSAPSASGALVGGATDEQVAVATKFGVELGLAYQIQDDTLDIVGEESALGKPVLTDLREGKKGLALIHCLNRCSKDDRDFVLGLLNRRGAYLQEETSRLRGILEKHGSLDYANEKVLRHTAAAREILGPLAENRAKSRLVELTDYLSARYY
jgi:geranylgeranyl diphosphate synthase type I